MILGERSLLDQRVKRDFQRTGSYHLLVVSGMAVAILAFAVFWICRLCRMPEVAATILSVIFVALYVTITDLGAPVQRAALMCGVYMLARLFYRGRDVLNAIGFAEFTGRRSISPTPPATTCTCFQGRRNFDSTCACFLFVLSGSSQNGSHE
jgi:hypothetical protein